MALCDMNTRLTSQWTPTLQEAFGYAGTKGRSAELFVKTYIDHLGLECRDCESNYEHQKSGVDLIVTIAGEDVTIDVKSNLNDSGVFFVEGGADGWLRHPNKTSKKIIHVNVENQTLCMYNRADMIRYIKENRHLRGELIKFDVRYLPSFIEYFKI